MLNPARRIVIAVVLTSAVAVATTTPSQAQWYGWGWGAPVVAVAPAYGGYYGYPAYGYPAYGYPRTATPRTAMELSAIACRQATPVTVLRHRAMWASPMASSRPLMATLTRRPTIGLIGKLIVSCRAGLRE
jgi:hypothetical protein